VILLRNSPLLVFVLSLVVLGLSARLGVFFRDRRGSIDDSARQDFDLVLGATLTLLALIIGFSFSMAVTRYDQRRSYEEEEANAIGTEYLRVGLLQAGEAAKLRDLLSRYLDQRILFYESRSITQLGQINSVTAKLQTDMWAAVQIPGTAQPTPSVALVLSGMNDVLNSQGYTQAAWSNRIPLGAWALMAAIAICSNLFTGFGLRSTKVSALLILVLPILVSISFLLIADIDSPRGGMIRVHPVNLISLSQSLHGTS